MLQFKALDTLNVSKDRVEASEVYAQPKRLAVLAYLVLATRRRPIRRDTLLGLFWPDLDASHARHSLSQALHFLRRAIGSDVIVSRSAEEIGVDVGHVDCDVWTFEDALDAQDLDAALAAYKGDLLAGFYIGGAPEFERWVESERARLRARAGTAAHTRAERAIAEDDRISAVRYAVQAIALDPLNERALRRVMRARDGVGDRAGALADYREFSARLTRELEAEPAPETQALAEGIRKREEQGYFSAEVRKSNPPSVPTPAGEAQASSSATPPARRRRLIAAAGVAALALASMLLVRGVGAGRPKPSTTKSAAEEAYDRGRYQLRTRTHERALAAVESFQKAIAFDSGYAPAYAGLADAYAALAEFVPAREILPLAAAAAERAVRLDPSNVDARLARADLALIFTRDWFTADDEYRRALRMDSRSIAAHERYARYLAAARRFDEHLIYTKSALKLRREANGVDPVDADLREHTALAAAYFSARNFEEALAHGLEARKLDPSSWSVNAVLGRTYIELHRYDEAIAALKLAWPVSQQLPALARLGYAYGRAGKRAEAEQVLRELRARADTSYVPKDQIALVQLGLGDRDGAIASLQRAFEERHWWLPWINQSPPFDLLRSDPRYAELLRQLGAP